MKKIVSVILAAVIMLSCCISVFAADTFEDKDKVVSIKIEDLFGTDPVIIDFGFDKTFETLEDFIPRFEINGVPDEDISFWLMDEILDSAELLLHTLQCSFFGSTTLTDESTGISVTFCNERYGEDYDDVKLEVKKLNKKEFWNLYSKEPLFDVGYINDSENDSYYLVKLINAETGTDAFDKEDYMYRLRIDFPLPEGYTYGLYEIGYSYPDGSNMGEYDYTYPTSNKLTYMLYDF